MFENVRKKLYKRLIKHKCDYFADLMKAKIS